MEYIAIPILAALCLWWFLRERARSRREREVNRELVLRLIDMNERVERLEATQLANLKSLPGRQDAYLLESSKAKESSAESVRPLSDTNETMSGADMRSSTVGDSVAHEVPTPRFKPSLVDSPDVRRGKAQSFDNYQKVGLAILVVAGVLSITGPLRWPGKSSVE
jgi:hypothetical protein